MDIRFMPWLAGYTIGFFICPALVVLANGEEHGTRWGLLIARACLEGLTSALFATVLQAVVATKRNGAAKVKFW